MFSGEYEYKIDPKGRVAIPPKFRGEFWQGIVLAKGLERCIIAYPPPLWNDLAERYSTLPIARSKERRMGRAMFATAFNLELDEQGRILLPPKLRQYAEIKDTVVIVGINNYLEIWSKELWDEELALTEEQAWQIAEGMERRQ